MKKFIIAVIVLVLGFSLYSFAQAAKNSEFKSLDARVQNLKHEVLQLNQELFTLEEELLFPANTQVAVFLSLDVGKFFKLDSVQLKIDKKVVTNYLYTKREIESLEKGGVQRLYVGNFRTGKHELVAFVRGKGPRGRDYRLGTNIMFNKKADPKYIELRILDVQGKKQPKFDVKVWQ
ncbi:MAG: AraC family transcriptional regulator [Acidiferrobacterales bacterium]